jgi:glycosyltransferase involved in cell wall biosynthesis
MMRRLDLVAAGDERHPNGASRYGHELASALSADGWSVRTVAPGADLRTDVAVLVDGALLERLADDLPAHAVPLLHAPPPDRAAALDPLLRAPALVTTSATVAEQVLDLLAGHDVPRIVVAQPGVGRTRPVATDPTGRRLRSIGALLPGRGQEVLLDALGRLRDLDWRLDLVGPADLDRVHVHALHERAVRLGIADRVLIAGARRPDPLPRLYEGCDLVVVPAGTTGYGTVVAEAIGCGLPVVAADTDGAREALGGRRSARPGLLVRPGDADELARALRAWLSSRGLRLDLAAAARARANHRRTWTTTAHAVAEALTRVGAPAAL